jgi:hypothetical protein
MGGLSGYAHVNETVLSNNVIRSLALEVPFGDVDFAEVLSLSVVGQSTWFDFLNLGFKLTPSAGTDYPWGNLPGAVRNYVKLRGQLTTSSWFDGLRNGRTFVTNGPILDARLNHAEMGTTLHLHRGDQLTLHASASLNPDFGEIAKLELIEQGDTVMTVRGSSGSANVTLNMARTADHGTWYVIRAIGTRPGVIAMSAPFYVSVDGDNFWKPEAVAAIASRMKEHACSILTASPKDDTNGLAAATRYNAMLAAQQVMLRSRVAEAERRYDALIARAEKMVGPAAASQVTGTGPWCH